MHIWYGQKYLPYDRLVATLNKLINIGGDAEEVCNFAHVETKCIRIAYIKNNQAVSICPHLFIYIIFIIISNLNRSRNKRTTV